MDPAPLANPDRRGQVGPVARALGFAGLLPQFAAVWLAWMPGALGPGTGQQFAFGYGALILSFLGGSWWGFAMGRFRGQGRMVAVAVLPSLVAFGIAIGTNLFGGTMRLALVALGSAIILTLPVDRHLFGTGEAPAGWMALRVPLSIGLGVLTMLAGFA